MFVPSIVDPLTTFFFLNLTILLAILNSLLSTLSKTATLSFQNYDQKEDNGDCVKILHLDSALLTTFKLFISVDCRVVIVSDDKSSSLVAIEECRDLYANAYRLTCLLRQ